MMANVGYEAPMESGKTDRISVATDPHSDATDRFSPTSICQSLGNRGMTSGGMLACD